MLYPVPSSPLAPVRRPSPALLNGAALPSRPPAQGASQDDAARVALAREAALAEAAAIRAREAAIDAALEMTFPASDPPAWTL